MQLNESKEIGAIDALSDSKEVSHSFLGIQYDEDPRRFFEISTDFAAETKNPDVMLPILRDGDQYLTDSWSIAEHVSKVLMLG